MLRLARKRRDKTSITCFGLLGHEVAVLKSTMECAPNLGDYEFREPNQAGACSIVVVNKDSQLALSWWKNYKKRYPSAVPLYVTDSKQDPDQNAYCKRPFSPSFVQAAFENLVGDLAARRNA